MLGFVVVLGSSTAFDALIPSASGSCPICSVGPYRSAYGYGRGYSYLGTSYGISRYGSYRQPFGSAHPRSLIGRYGSGYGYGGYGYGYGGYGGYASTLIAHHRFGNTFSLGTPAGGLRYGRSFRYPARSFLPRYRVYYGQSTPSLPGTVLREFQFVSTESSAPAVPADEGWILLTEGSVTDAIVAFDDRISDNPGNMLAKVGLAVSLAAAGDLTAGAWHMRQACSSDRKVLKMVPLNANLQHQLRHLIRNYESSLVKNNANRQRLFMLATLHYLAGEQRAAATAVSTAIHNGDRTSAARYLQELINNYDVDHQPTLAQY